MDSRAAADTKTQGRMPVLFVGHGSPMNSILDNVWSRGFAALTHDLPEPRAILAVSAHWFLDGTFVTADTQPRTIHDFGGFPQALYEMQYPAPGQPQLADRVRHVLGEQRAALSAEWGLDHGTWSVLHWMYPDARIPVLQLSIHSGLSVAQHVELAHSLSELRHEGVLILASGNITHNLRDAMGRMRSGVPATPDWASRFDQTVANVLQQRDTKKLLTLWPGSADGQLAHPSPDHYLPLLYAYGATDTDDRVTFPVEGFDLGSLSMRSVRFG